MNTSFDIMALTLVLPLLGALIIGTVGKNWGRANSALLAGSAVGASFLIVVANIVQLLMTPVGAQSRSVDLWIWAQMPSLDKVSTIGFGIYVDALSLTLMSVITGVGFLIHWFSSEYMKDDPEYTRYFCLLNLFIAAMTLLVLANNFATLIIGWGGVGFASFALIGFWREKPSAAAASKKAFVMNVIGDIGLMLAVFVLFRNVGVLDFQTLFDSPNSPLETAAMQGAWLPWVVFGLLVGAYAKSAQLPLHTWLPDAMEGPTPVSALIHAATMVTAGVYLLVRSHPILELYPSVMPIIAALGALTALYAACCAMVQNDLKRVLAYSTMSQLGYMFMAVGLGAYGAAIFHLVTHAFFKALLFLTAGIVIHTAHGEQDMRRLGGLSKDIPFTCFMFAVGGAALAGVPLTSGFFSKEFILHAAHYHQGGTVFFLLGALVAVMTAFYTGRAFFMTFYGPQKVEHPHLPGGPTTLSCALLTILAAAGGSLAQPLSEFLDPSQGSPGFQIEPGATSWPAIILSALVLVAIAAAWGIYGKGQPDKLGRNSTVFNFVRSGFRVDEFYESIATGFTILGRLANRGLDRLFTLVGPGLVDGSFTSLGQSLRETQTGQIRHYMLSIMVSVVVLLFYSLLIGGGLSL